MKIIAIALLIMVGLGGIACEKRVVKKRKRP
jgi:hypothetical protein